MGVEPPTPKTQGFPGDVSRPGVRRGLSRTREGEAMHMRLIFRSPDSRAIRVTEEWHCRRETEIPVEGRRRELTPDSTASLRASRQRR